MTLGIEHRVFRAGLRAALPAALVSGLPSTIHALLVKRDPLEASIAAGSVLLPHERRRARLLIAAVPVHAGLSVAWGVALAALLPRRIPVVEGALAGLVIASIDLGLGSRRFSRIRALRTGPQVADHIAFGVVAAVSLARSSGGGHG